MQQYLGTLELKRPSDWTRKITEINFLFSHGKTGSEAGGEDDQRRPGAWERGPPGATVMDWSPAPASRDTTGPRNQLLHIVAYTGPASKHVSMYP